MSEELLVNNIKAVYMSEMVLKQSEVTIQDIEKLSKDIWQYGSSLAILEAPSIVLNGANLSLNLESEE